MRQYATLKNGGEATRGLILELEKMGALQQRVTVQKRVSDPKYPRFVYRYLGFDSNRADSVERLRDVLVTSELYLSPVTDFNDPFDTKAHMYVGGTEADLERKLKELHADRDRVPGRLGKSLGQVIREAKADKGNLTNMVNRSVERYAECSGIVCFTSKPRDILMWSHYARNHKGIVLQFAPSYDMRLFSHMVPMIYADDYPHVDFVSFGADEISQILRQKFSAWKYENEWRLMVSAGAKCFVPFKPESLTGVILGCRTEAEDIAALKTISDTRAKVWKSRKVDLEVYKAELHRSSYRIRLRRSSL